MRSLVLLCVGLTLSAAPLFAQQVGDTVAVIAPTDARIGNNVVYRYQPGMTLIVSAVKGEWLWTNHKVSGWLHRRDVASLDDAVAHFTGAIARNPQDAAAYVSRGCVCSAKRDWDSAILDFGEAIRIDSKNLAAFGNRAIAWRNKQEYDKAIDDYNHALWLHPRHATLYRNRGICFRHLGEYQKALSDFDEAIRLEPEQGAGYNSRAWLYATCPEARFRNGRQAYADAQRACELASWKSADFLSTLAAAYAENGDFEQAVTWQTKAIEMAPDEHQDDHERWLAAFRAGQPYREKLTSATTGGPSTAATQTSASRISPQHATAVSNRE